ncbi:MULTISPECIES: DNA/RNA nuclease SfsA [Megasphaera]|uniref:Sugar fermentation stimulation protein homolog n=1 Tax=Megasphaera vaginalis (ex Srinivasan et al. 2021) TaxID=1111454 RepID=U7UHG5_9FIRM|nr:MULTISPECIES: DNA/RNA nuclease SfsA [Megasphaera]ERT58736.1 sugar fermentation stimulation protein [Megasphaera vaginalis (ex Srinivasan et al. 2021)]
MEKRDLIKASFIDRPNRFIVHAAADAGVVTCHLPNPGRLWELLFPGVTLWLRRAAAQGKVRRKTAYDVVGIERDGVPVLMDTQYTNDVAASLIERQAVPGWEGWHVFRREVTIGESRFDLLLKKGEELFFVEVKSCSLFGSDGGAMFPDAVTERGRKHLLHLVALKRQGFRTGLLFLVQWPRARWFLPDYHTDPAFAAAFYEAAPYLDWKALAVAWDETFTLPEPRGLLAYPEDVLRRENRDGGDYLIVVEMPADATVAIGSLGPVFFAKGFYVYVGSAKRNLSARLARHGRRRKKLRWHFDYLRAVAEIVAPIPIRTADDLECELARAVGAVADRTVPRFGCSDCSCDSHLFAFNENPMNNRTFMRIIEDFRINRLGNML